MNVTFLTYLALVAFAANSVLTKFALAQGQIGPEAFVAIRLFSGAVTLMLLVALRRGLRSLPTYSDPLSALALLSYAVTFSFAYITLDTGIGALILFGGVQVTMFAGALITGERPHLMRWIGTILGMSGLAILFAPGAQAPDLVGAILMVIAAISWGIYSLRGRSISDPLSATAMNFVFAAPIGIVLWLTFPSDIPTSFNGVLLAIASGALASGIGYAIWYSVLTKLDGSLAAILQLTVPVIALGGGILFLGETATWDFAIASTFIFVGVLLAVFSKKTRKS